MTTGVPVFVGVEWVDVLDVSLIVFETIGHEGRRMEGVQVSQSQEANSAPIWLAPCFAGACSLVWFDFADPFLAPKVLALCGLCIYWLPRGRMVQPSLPEVGLWLWPVVTGWWVVNQADYFRSVALLGLIALPRFLFVPLHQSMRRAIAEGLTWSGVLAALVTLAQAAGWLTADLEPAGVYAGSLFGNANLTAAWLLLALTLGQGPRGRWRWLCQALLIAAILACRSRGVFLCLAVWLWFRCADLPLNWRRTMRGSLIIGLILGGSILAYRERAGWKHLRDPATYATQLAEQPTLIAERSAWFRGKRLSVMTRQILWANAAVMARDHLWIGAGLGQFRVTYPAYARAWFDDPHMTREYRAASAHQVLLDGVIQLGMPFILLAIWFCVRLWRRTLDQRYRLALALQFGLALATLNYLYPLIPMTLIMLYPGAGERSRHVKRSGWIAVVLLICVSAWCLTNLRTGLAHTNPERWAPVTWDHAALAEQAYAAGDLAKTWEAQRLVFLGDPYGPSTLHNLASAASVVGSEDAAWAWQVARLAHDLVQQLHPYYRPARERVFDGRLFQTREMEEQGMRSLPEDWRQDHDRLRALVIKHRITQSAGQAEEAAKTSL